MVLKHVYLGMAKYDVDGCSSAYGLFVQADIQNGSSIPPRVDQKLLYVSGPKYAREIHNSVISKLTYDIIFCCVSAK